MALPISVCIIARDEETALPDCLASVVPHVAQVVLADTGSQDATIQIARQQGAQVHHFTWIDDFSAARNFAASLATQPWILVLDADERLTPESIPALETFCSQAACPRGGAGSVRRVNIDDDGTTVLTSETTTRLYPNSADYAYVNRVHEQLTFRGQAPQRIETLAAIVHSGYGSRAIVPKLARNLRLLQLAGAPEDPYLLYQLGRTYEATGQHAEAVEPLGAALEKLTGTSPETVPYMSALLLQLGYALLNTRDLPGLFSVLSLATDLYPDYTDLYFLYGLGLMELDDPGRLEDVRQAFEYCLELGEPDPSRYESVAGVGSFRAAHNLAVYHSLTATPPAESDGTSVTPESATDAA